MTAAEIRSYPTSFSKYVVMQVVRLSWEAGAPTLKSQPITISGALQVQRNSDTFDLIGISMHTGGSITGSSGHYETAVKYPNNVWYWESDRIVEEWTEAEILQRAESTAALLVWKKR